MGKNKFIDKKKSATFQLFARDSSDPNYSNPAAGDHVFVRVDNNPISVTAFSEDQDPLPGSENDDQDDDIFADAPGDYDGDEDTTWYDSSENYSNQRKPLPDDVRREIIELGFPDDGYNYLIHMREIKNSGVGSVYYPNPKATVEPLKPDVKAYNASRIDVTKIDEVRDEKELFAVASKAATARVEKVVDDEIAALLDDDSDLSRFGSDVEDLEEDFVVMANLPEGPTDVELDKKPLLEKESNEKESNVSVAGKSDLNIPGPRSLATANDEKPRALRPLDEQFESLLLKEYGTDSDDGYDGCDDRFAENEESLAEKLNNAFKFHSVVDGLEQDGKCTVISNILQPKGEYGMESSEDAADVIKRCKEYGEKYENESDDGMQEIFEESSDESEKWDCETVVSTYSNLDNLPGKIGAPEMRRKNKLVERLSAAMSSEKNIITLGGKDKLPLDFLPNARKLSANKVDSEDKGLKPEHKRKPHGQESKEEKKERKAAVKEEKREARRVKKEVKELYRGEAHRAQRVAASTGPSSIHLM